MFKATQQEVTQSTESGRPYALDAYGRLSFDYDYKPPKNAFPFLLSDALQGIGGRYSTGTTEVFGNLFFRASAAEKQEMVPATLSAITQQMQTAHDIIDRAPQREAQIRAKIAEEGVGYKVLDAIVDAPDSTAAANKKLVQALAVLHHVVYHASGYINPANAGSLQQLLVDTLVKESVSPDVRKSAGYWLEEIQNRNPKAFAAPERAASPQRAQPQEKPKV